MRQTDKVSILCIAETVMDAMHSLGRGVLMVDRLTVNDSRELLHNAGTEHKFEMMDARKSVEHELKGGGLLSIVH